MLEGQQMEVGTEAQQLESPFYLLKKHREQQQVVVVVKS